MMFIGEAMLRDKYLRMMINLIDIVTEEISLLYFKVYEMCGYFSVIPRFLELPRKLVHLPSSLICAQALLHSEWAKLVLAIMCSSMLEKLVAIFV